LNDWILRREDFWKTISLKSWREIKIKDEKFTLYNNNFDKVDSDLQTILKKQNWNLVYIYWNSFSSKPYRYLIDNEQEILFTNDITLSNYIKDTDTYIAYTKNKIIKNGLVEETSLDKIFYTDVNWNKLHIFWKKDYNLEIYTCNLGWLKTFKKENINVNYLWQNIKIIDEKYKCDTTLISASWNIRKNSSYNFNSYY